MCLVCIVVSRWWRLSVGWWRMSRLYGRWCIGVNIGWVLWSCWNWCVCFLVCGGVWFVRLVLLCFGGVVCGGVFLFGVLLVLFCWWC